jgi:GT2 family glycosyltransferase
LSSRIVVYTGLTAGYDPLCPSPPSSAGYDHVCFSDDALLDTVGWDHRPLPYHSADPKRSVSWVKLNPERVLPGHEWSIWIDANVSISIDPAELVDDVERSGALMGAFLHVVRDCVYDEAATVVDLGLDDEEIVRQQIDRYRAEALPRHLGLHVASVLVRRHADDEVRAFDRAWWREYINGSRRDQLSLDVARWRTGLAIHPLGPPGSTVVDDPRFVRRGHLTRRAATPWVTARVDRDPFPFIEPPTDVVSPTLVVSRPPASGARRPPVDIVIPAHDAHDDVVRCLGSVLSTLAPGDRLILVDDGSASPTRDLCADTAARNANVHLLRRPEGSGFSKAANAGLLATTADYVIVLNSDTEVSSGWIDKLVRCADSGPSIGIVGPLSNAAAGQSIPTTVPADNQLPVGYDLTAINLYLETWSEGTCVPLMPVLSGFCLLIARRVLDEVGPFDETAFPLGYGEDRDYCFRAVDAGYDLAIATNTYVAHAHSKSYGPSAAATLRTRSAVTLTERYGRHRLAEASTSAAHHPVLDALRSDLAILRRAPAQDGRSTIAT